MDRGGWVVLDWGGVFIVSLEEVGGHCLWWRRLTKEGDGEVVRCKWLVSDRTRMEVWRIVPWAALQRRHDPGQSQQAKMLGFLQRNDRRLLQEGRSGNCNGKGRQW